MNEHSEKQKYETKEEAQAAISQQKYFYDVDTELDVYRCHECNLWHITSR